METAPVVRLGLVGFGTVGQALVRLIQSGEERLGERLGVRLAVRAIGNRGIERKKAGWVKGAVRWTDDLESVVTDPEVDLVVEEGTTLYPVEVKSGATVAGDMLGALAWWSAMAGTEGGEATLVHGGLEAFTRSGVAVRPWFAV